MGIPNKCWLALEKSYVTQHRGPGEAEVCGDSSTKIQARQVKARLCGTWGWRAASRWLWGSWGIPGTTMPRGWLVGLWAKWLWTRGRVAASGTDTTSWVHNSAEGWWWGTRPGAPSLSSSHAAQQPRGSVARQPAPVRTAPPRPPPWPVAGAAAPHPTLALGLGSQRPCIYQTPVFSLLTSPVPDPCLWPPWGPVFHLTKLTDSRGPRWTNMGTPKYRRPRRRWGRGLIPTPAQASCPQEEASGSRPGGGG